MMEKNNVVNSVQQYSKTNVHIKVMNAKTKKVLYQIDGSNRVTKLALMGLVKFTNGEFNSTSPEYNEFYRKYIPRYLAFGTNVSSSNLGSVTSTVTVNDARLLSEIRETDGSSIRQLLPQRNIISNRETDPYIKLIIRAYVPEQMYNNEVIREAGLFTDKDGNNCWARIALPVPIHKTEDIVLDVIWELTFVSMESTNQPYEETGGLKATLFKLITDNIGRIEGQYTPETWKIFSYQLNLAQAVYYYYSATQEVTQDRIDELSKAIEQLQRRKYSS